MIKIQSGNLITLASSNLLLYAIVRIIRLSIVVAQPAVTVIIVAINYTGNKIWTFKK
jgi:putative flippase GtrA